MKRRLLPVFMLLFVIFLLVGCDRSVTTVTTVTTQPQTTVTTQLETTQPETTQPETTQPQTTQQITTTEGDDVYYTVIFYNGDGSVIATRSVLEGTDALAPTETAVKVATAQYTYTFANWDISYTNVNSNISVNPVFTETLNSYTVVFYNNDETVISTQTVDYGSSASAPSETPLKASEGTNIYTFSYWDAVFTNVSEDLDVHPVFTQSFNQTLLNDMVTDMFGEDDDDFDSEEMIDDLLMMTEFSSELELYTMLEATDNLMDQLMTVETGSEFQTWYAATKTAGMNKEFLISTMFNFMKSSMNNDLASIARDLTEASTELADIQNVLVENQTGMTDVDAYVNDYCTNHIDSELTTTCSYLYQAFKDAEEAYTDFDAIYHSAINDYYEEWNYDTYDSLIFQLNYVAMLRYDEENLVAANQAYTNYMIQLDNLGSYERNMYSNVLNAYNAYVNQAYYAGGHDFDGLDVLDDGVTNYTIRTNITYAFYGNQDVYDETNILNKGYNGYAQIVSDQQWMFGYLSEEVNELSDELEEIGVVTTFLNNPTSETQIKGVMETAYDALDAVLLTADDDMVEMVMDMVSEELNVNVLFDSDINPITMINEMLTSENIVFAADKIETVLSAFLGTLDASDYANLKAALLSYMEIQLTTEDLTENEAIAYLAVLGATYDKYALHFQDLSVEIVSFLQSMDETKADAIISLKDEAINMMLLGMGTMDETDMVILASNAIDVLFGDDSFDLSLLLEILVDIDFDIEEELNPDTDLVNEAKVKVEILLTDALALVELVKDYDATYLSEAQVEDIIDLIYSVNTLDRWLNNAVFNEVDSSEYFEELLADLIDNMLDVPEGTDGAVVFMDIFGTLDDESTYYRAKSVFQYVLGLTELRSFDSLQTWVGNLESFGHTQSEMINYFVSIFKYNTDFDMAEDGIDEDDFINIIYDLINDEDNRVLSEEAIGLILDDFQNMIGTMPQESFEIVNVFLENLMEAQKNMIMNDDEDFDFGDLIPTDPQLIYDFTQDLSALIKLRAESLDATDLETLEDYIDIVIEAYVAGEELESAEATALETSLKAQVMEYIGYADFALGEFTDLLDSLTLAKIEMIIDYVDIMDDDTANGYVKTIMTAKIADAILLDSEIDLDAFVEIYLKVYYDFEEEGYTPSELLDVQSEWTTYIGELEVSIEAIADYDINNIDSTMFPALVEFQQKAMFLTTLFDYPTDVTDYESFVFDIQQLRDIVGDIFPDADYMGVTYKITQLLDILSLEPEENEDLYYILLGVGSVIGNVDDLESPMDLLGIYGGLSTLGYDNEALAEIMMNLVEVFLVPDLPAMYDMETVQNNIQSAMVDLEDYQEEFDDLNTEVLAEIALITDENPMVQAGMMQEATQLWEYALASASVTSTYNIMHNQYASEDYFNEDDWNYLTSTWDMGNYDDAYDYIEEYCCNEGWMYYDLLMYYDNHLNSGAEYLDLISNWNSAYDYYNVSFDNNYSFSAYISDSKFEVETINLELYDAQSDFDMYNQQLVKMEENAWMFETIDTMLSSTYNFDLTKQVLVILLDQVDAWTNDQGIEDLFEIIMMFEDGFENVTAVELQTKLQEVGSSLTMLLATIDVDDEAVIEAWLTALAGEYAKTQSDDSVAIALIQTTLSNIISSYFNQLMDIPYTIGQYVITYDVAKTQDLLDQLQLLEMAQYMDSSDTAMAAKIIALANIFEIVGDGTLNLTTVYQPIFEIVYDINSFDGVLLLPDKTVMLTEINTQILAIMAQTSVIADMDYEDISLTEYDQIEAFVELIETFAEYLDFSSEDYAATVSS